MRTLIIHPEDSSTIFLKPVYEPVAEKTVITGGVTKEALLDLIRSHNRVMLMGHGSPSGLLAVGQFPGAGAYIIDYTAAPLMKEKKNSVFIWCNADQYVTCYELEGFYTGMFVSELSEAWLMKLKMTNQFMVDESNLVFGPIAGRYINEDSSQTICENIKRDYGRLSSKNPVVLYNNNRLYYACQ